MEEASIRSGAECSSPLCVCNMCMLPTVKLFSRVQIAKKINLCVRVCGFSSLQNEKKTLVLSFHLNYVLRRYIDR